MELMESRPWELLLPRLGIPIAPDGGPPYLIAGDIVFTLSDEELDMVIRKGAVFDSRAIEGLMMSDRGGLINISELLPLSRNVNERLTADPLNGSVAGWTLPLRNMIVEDGIFREVKSFKLKEGARILSEIIDLNGSPVGPGVIGLELNNGARIGVLPYSLQATLPLPTHVPAPIAAGFVCLPRQRQLIALLEWIIRSHLPCHSLNMPNLYPVYLEDGEEVLLSVINLSFDFVEDGEIELGCLKEDEVESIQELGQDGTWKSSDISMLSSAHGVLNIRVKLSPWQMKIFRLKKR